ncbi:hypothetical protein [Palleronia sp. LCG004]|uniref:hypothetical protein n=1 Tax=Palleronia sp. LCG004 TaxID=3079304 RepID=UPI0029427A59|nr:hypothetical protein [Palleronia sp. LCG004]WOI56913.1 hypothetical protein RVY76_03710 [Palleronia sp. LCG004]
MKWPALFLVAITVSACTPASRDDVTRSAARSVVSRVVLDWFPGVPLQPAIDCVIDNASTPELRGLASDAVLGPTAATTESVIRIASRPQTVDCLARDGVAPFLG